MNDDPKQRFTRRVEDYVKYRPGYPLAIVSMLMRETGFNAEAVVADVGSGTGKLAHLFLKHGCIVYGVEPNAAMRAAGEGQLANFPRFHSVDGAAEATTLAADSVDYVTAGQAFHWFDHTAARAEFRRILRPEGCVVLVWNNWRAELSPLLHDVEQLLQQFSADYGRVRHSATSGAEVLARFFAPGSYQRRTFDNAQQFDFAGLRGRLLSSSYSPPPETAQYEPMLAELQAIFERHQQGGQVTFQYETQVYYGRLS